MDIAARIFLDLKIAASLEFDNPARPFFSTRRHIVQTKNKIMLQQEKINNDHYNNVLFINNK